jgi:hypothetical protein
MDSVACFANFVDWSTHYTTTLVANSMHGLGAPEADPLAFTGITVMGEALGQISLRKFCRAECHSYGRARGQKEPGEEKKVRFPPLKVWDPEATVSHFAV